MCLLAWNQSFSAALSKEEIKKADAVLFVQTDTILGARQIALIKMTDLKPVVFLFNCWHTTHGQVGWIPESQVNVDACQKIASQLEKDGTFVLPVNDRRVVPVNVLWAQFGLGQPIFGDQNEGDIADFARTKLHLDLTGSALRNEMLVRSGFLPVRDFLRNLPLELLKHVVSNPQREINRIADRFATEFKKRWTAA